MGLEGLLTELQNLKDEAEIAVPFPVLLGYVRKERNAFSGAVQAGCSLYEGYVFVSRKKDTYSFRGQDYIIQEDIESWEFLPKDKMIIATARSVLPGNQITVEIAEI